MTKAIKKLNDAANTDGYKLVSEKTGISVTRLNDLRKERNDSLGVTLRVAFKLREVYGIEFNDWFEEVE